MFKSSVDNFVKACSMACNTRLGLGDTMILMAKANRRATTDDSRDQVGRSLWASSSHWTLEVQMLQGYCRRFQIQPTAYDVLTCFIQYSASIEESMVSESTVPFHSIRQAL